MYFGFMQERGILNVYARLDVVQKNHEKKGGFLNQWENKNLKEQNRMSISERSVTWTMVKQH